MSDVAAGRRPPAHIAACCRELAVATGLDCFDVTFDTWCAYGL